ncbi:unnamed protein product [Meganyctiphanes norvegica]|uniref:Uncharacterized protein n=1 Tax=Meganyctiphanes norvegica TaxID=48144 RepID=A0AAV2QKL1_MEGNR
MINSSLSAGGNAHIFFRNFSQGKLDEAAGGELCLSPYVRGLADGTWANRVSHLRSYVTFTTYYGASDFPVQLGVLLRFIAFLGRGPYTYRSVTNLLASIRWFNSFLAPSSTKVFEAVLVKAALKGLKEQLSRPVRQKLPFSVEHLKCYYVLDFSDVKQLACWCAMLLAFFGCFRLSNLVVN